MQLILAESAPHRGRAVAFAVALALVALLAVFAVARGGHHHRRYGYHHQLTYVGKCVYTQAGYVFLTR
jgi:hypothetical protein